MRRAIVGAAALALLSLRVLVGWCRGLLLLHNSQRSTRITVTELSPAPGTLALPLKSGSIRFAVIGDSGRGDQAQNDVAQQTIAWRMPSIRRSFRRNV